jgi:hypothetical protein
MEFVDDAVTPPSLDETTNANRRLSGDFDWCSGGEDGS